MTKVLATAKNIDNETLNKLFSYCLALCKQRDDAYDLLHDSVEKFLQQSPADVNSPLAFIKSIARNRFYDQQRRKKVVYFDVLEEEEFIDSESELENILIDELTLNRVWELLSASEREVVYLWAAEGLTASEIAKELNIARATVLSRLRRLRLRIERDYSSNQAGETYDG